jgi:hypothetical protein
VACGGVELGHELAVGGPGGGQVLVAFFELQAQFDGLLLKIGDLLLGASKSAGAPSPDSRHACSPSASVRRRSSCRAWAASRAARS